MLPQLISQLNIQRLLTMNGAMVRLANCVIRHWDFWKTQTLKLPNWSKAVDECALVMMSTGAVERVFSLYIAFFGDLRESVL